VQIYHRGGFSPPQKPPMSAGNRRCAGTSSPAARRGGRSFQGGGISVTSRGYGADFRLRSAFRRSNRNGLGVPINTSTEGRCAERALRLHPTRSQKISGTPMAGENLDLANEPDPSGAGSRGRSESRRFLGIRFACCGVYARVYVNVDETAYEGRCPRCYRQVRVRIGPGGTDTRFFTAY
jgi:hypothetical protein